MIDFDRILFNTDIDSRKPAPGTLLVAEPFLRDEYFSHAVVCLVEYGEAEAAMGIVLNHRTSYTLSDILPGLNTATDVPVYCGGPVGCDRLYFIHTIPEIIPGSHKIRQGLYIGGDINAMTEYVNSGYPTEGYMRFFIGYSGWSESQLDMELDERTWAVTEINQAGELLSGSGDPYWHRMVRSLGDSFRGWLFHPQNRHAN